MQHFTYLNPLTRTQITIEADTSEIAWQKLCKRISPTDQFNYVLRERMCKEHRIMMQEDFALYLKIATNYTSQCVKRQLWHHTQRLDIRIINHFKTEALDSKRDDRHERALANVLYDTLNLN